MTRESPEPWHVYIVRARDGTLYTGIATDPDRRAAEHAGTRPGGAKYLRGRGPVRLEYDASVGDRGLAQRVEYRIKRLSRSKKEELLRNRPDSHQLLLLLFGEDLPR